MKRRIINLSLALLFIHLYGCVTTSSTMDDHTQECSSDAGPDGANATCLGDIEMSSHADSNGANSSQTTRR